MGVITKVEACKKNKNRANIYIDGEFALSCFLEVCYLNKIKPGLEISEENLKQLVLAEEIAKAESYATGLLGKFSKTETEVKRKLTEKGYSPEVIKPVLEKLKKYGYVNDQTFAKNYVSTYKTTKSKAVIKRTLKQKGISDLIIAELEFDEENEISAAEVLANKWIKNKEKTRDNFYKLNNYLYNKGFSPEMCKKTTNRLFRNILIEDE